MQPERTARSRRQRASTPWQDRFWRFVAPAGPDECWEWHGARDKHGYGRLARGGKHGGAFKAHRASFAIHHGDPAGIVVCHSCDNPPCVNPAHLFAGTMQDNSRDMAAKGRSAAQRGHSNGREKLTNEQVRAVREQAAAGVPRKDIAVAFGIRAQSVSALVYGQRRLAAGGPIEAAAA